MKFYKEKTRTVTDLVPFTKDELIVLLKTKKPNQLYNTEWSRKQPLYLLKNYSESGVELSCSGIVDKDYHYKSWDDVWGVFKNYLKYMTDKID